MNRAFSFALKMDMKTASPEREELARLRKENRELRSERDILKKAAAFFAKHQQ